MYANGEKGVAGGGEIGGNVVEGVCYIANHGSLSQLGNLQAGRYRSLHFRFPLLFPHESEIITDGATRSDVCSRHSGILNASGRRWVISPWVAHRSSLDHFAAAFWVLVAPKARCFVIAPLSSAIARLCARWRDHLGGLQPVNLKCCRRGLSSRWSDGTLATHSLLFFRRYMCCAWVAHRSRLALSPLLFPPRSLGYVPGGAITSDVCNQSILNASGGLIPLRSIYATFRIRWGPFVAGGSVRGGG